MDGDSDGSLSTWMGRGLPAEPASPAPELVRRWGRSDTIKTPAETLTSRSHELGQGLSRTNVTSNPSPVRDEAVKHSAGAELARCNLDLEITGP
eukprot:s1293_g15.t1